MSTRFIVSEDGTKTEESIHYGVYDIRYADSSTIIGPGLLSQSSYLFRLRVSYYVDTNIVLLYGGFSPLPIRRRIPLSPLLCKGCQERQRLNPRSEEPETTMRLRFHFPAISSVSRRDSNTDFTAAIRRL